jgi:hypothetical protein
MPCARHPPSCPWKYAHIRARAADLQGKHVETGVMEVLNLFDAWFDGCMSNARLTQNVSSRSVQKIIPVERASRAARHWIRQGIS